ncbi:Very-long-chain 3-oxooacyl-coA reductase [Apiospora phragmitis]|uniref:Very-long-chain 3-oxooacyl-coA reductase n=1 Tax=Apiospora phragmitis TaxID=2905665 RepID=A0ABR1SUP9_9PEZI
MGIFSSTPSNVLVQPRNTPGAPSTAWAVLTGSTTGIGRDIAHELCSRGFNVVIHGRNEGRLEELAKTLQADHGVRVVTLLLDASTAFNPESYSQTRAAVAELESLNVRVLVNNVGTGHAPEGFKPFDRQTAQDVSTVLNVNVAFMTHLTHALLPALKKSAGGPKDPSFVVNAGSLADMGLPYAAVYAGTKGYMRAFSLALDTELHAEGAHVHVVASIIGDTDSDGHHVGVNLFTPSSRDMARMVVQSAAASGGGVVLPYRLHSLQEWMCALQPYWMLRAGMGMHMKALVEKYAKTK